jgi:hypothetical protein
MYRAILFSIIICVSNSKINAQNSSGINTDSVYTNNSINGTSKLSLKQTDNFCQALEEKTNQFNRRFDRKTDKNLRKLIKKEKRLLAKLKNHDTLLAKNICGNFIDSIQGVRKLLGKEQLQFEKLNQGEYFPFLDTASTALRYMSTIKNLPKSIKERIGNATEIVEQTETRIAISARLSELLNEHGRVLNEYLGKYKDLQKSLRKISKQGWYALEQIKELKSVLKEPKKIEKYILVGLRKIPGFSKFMKENGLLAGLYPDNLSSSILMGQSVNLTGGLQSRIIAQQNLQQRIGGGPNATQVFQQQLSVALAQLNQLKGKVGKVVGLSGLEMPANKINDQKLKSFTKRVHFSFNIQTAKAVNNLPKSVAFGIQVGYRILPQITIGIGSAYKTAIKGKLPKVQLTNQGFELRSFIDGRIKGGFYLSGGFEKKYDLIAETNIYPTYLVHSESALMGVMKKIKLNKKMYSEFRLYYDFLHKHQPNLNRAWNFRIGYSFN